MAAPDLSPEQRCRVALIAESYRRLTGRALADGDDADALWAAPRAIVAHGTEADPLFYFGNRVALRVFEMTFEAFTQMPSRLSAEQQLREERATTLERVMRCGIVEDYAGVRISATGRRFRITNAAVWIVSDAHGHVTGQAAAFAV